MKKHRGNCKILPSVKTTSRRAGYTNKYPFCIQIEQVHLLTGYFGNGHLRVTENFTAPQWHFAKCVVRSSSEVVSTKERMAGAMGLGSFLILMVVKVERVRERVDMLHGEIYLTEAL